MLIKALFVASVLLSTGSRVAGAVECPTSLAADALVPGGYKLALVAIGKKVGPEPDVDTIYFFNGTCECSFGAPPNVEFSNREIEAAAASKSGVRGIVKKIAHIKGQCPSVLNRWSPSLQCYNPKSPTCRKAMN